MARTPAVTESVFEYVRDKIRSGAWAVGDKLPSENTLTGELNISRSTLREVLKQYIALGILASYQGRGTYVISNAIDLLTGNVSHGRRDRDEIASAVEDVLEFRLLVEPRCVAMFMEREELIRRQFIAEMEKCNARMEENVGKANPFIAADIAFHILFAEGSGNRVFAESMRVLFEKTLLQHRQINSLFGFQDGLRCHRRILDAVREGASGKAEREMRHHIQQALAALQDGARTC